MIILQSPPPPPSYTIFMPMVANNSPRDYICDYITCDYLVYMGDPLWFVEDEGIYNIMTQKSTIMINREIYVKVESGSDVEFVRPNKGFVMVYTKVDGLIYWTTYEKLIATL